MARRLFLSAVLALAAGSVSPLAQRGGPPPVPRAQAPYDITGYWVALVTDDWRYRMLTPPKGNADYIPVTPAARKVMEAWDPARDEAAGEACRGYGAGGVMRLPGRLHITWVNDTTLRVETSAGTQTRTFTFAQPATPGSPASVAAAAAPSWQGASVARWTFPISRGRGPVATAQLTVTTTGLRPGYVRKNGIPYGANAVITENFVRLADEGGEYLAVTVTVDDPLYFAQPYVKTYQYMKERDGSGWSPTPCSAR